MRSPGSAITEIPSKSGLPIFHAGPPLGPTPLPAFIYFALSGEESLATSPYNTPVTLLSELPVHCFSFTLPNHGHNIENKYAVAGWAKNLEQDPYYVTSFIEACEKNIQELVDKGYINENFMAVGGLSRGGFIASHLAARDERIRAVLGYAPLTDLTYIEEFKNFSNQLLLKTLNLETIADKLTRKRLRFYVGNRDLRVGTAACFHFINKIVEEAYNQGLRTSEAELIISSSVGHKGHGTLPHVFASGVRWLKTYSFPT